MAQHGIVLVIAHVSFHPDFQNLVTDQDQDDDDGSLFQFSEQISVAVSCCLTGSEVSVPGVAGSVQEPVAAWLQCSGLHEARSAAGLSG